jgi:hypothetical protein
MSDEGKSHWYEICPECGAQIVCNDLRFFPAHQDARDKSRLCFGVSKGDD